MTRRLEMAFQAVAKLSPAEQDALAEAILAEIASSDADWDQRFAHSAETLANLADEALAEHRGGQTKRLDPDSL